MKLLNWLTNRARRRRLRLKTGLRLSRYARSRWLNGVLITTLSMTSIYFFLRSDLFLIKQVQIESVSGSLIQQSKVEARVRFYLARSIFSVNTEKIEQEITASFLPVREVRVDKIFPSTLRINYDERQPVVELRLEGQSYLVDVGGLIFAETPPGRSLSIPQINIGFDELDLARERVLGQRLQQMTVTRMLEVGAFAWEDVKLMLRKIEYRQENMVLVFADPVDTDRTWETLLSEEKEVAMQLGTLVSIIHHAESQGKKLAQIDLRFDRAVVIYQ